MRRQGSRDAVHTTISVADLSCICSLRSGEEGSNLRIRTDDEYVGLIGSTACTVTEEESWSTQQKQSRSCGYLPAYDPRYGTSSTYTVRFSRVRAVVVRISGMRSPLTHSRFRLVKGCR